MSLFGTQSSSVFDKGYSKNNLPLSVKKKKKIKDKNFSNSSK